MMPSVCQIALQFVRRGVTNEDSTQKEDSQESSNMSKVSTKIVVGDSQIGKDTNAPTSSVETIKSFTEPNQAESGPSLTEISNSQEVFYVSIESVKLQ